MASISVSANPIRQLFDSLRNALSNYQEKRVLFAKYTRTFRELDRLTDHDLADIGVHRSEIADIAYKHVYG